ncbi:5584_t:CDS:2, partial [Funneliformis caledonium]
SSSNVGVFGHIALIIDSIASSERFRILINNGLVYSIRISDYRKLVTVANISCSLEDLLTVLVSGEMLILELLLFLLIIEEVDIEEVDDERVDVIKEVVVEEVGDLLVKEVGVEEVSDLPVKEVDVEEVDNLPVKEVNDLVKGIDVEDDLLIKGVIVDVPRYKKRTKKCHPLSTIQPSTNTSDSISNNIFGSPFVFQTDFNHFNFNDFIINQKEVNNNLDDSRIIHDQNEVEIDHDKDDSRIIRDEIDYEQDEVEINHDDDDNSSTNQDEALPTFKTYDDSPHLSHYQGDYGPYFPTFTAMALFI